MATFTSRATLSYNDSIINSNTVTGEIVDPVTVSKAAGATYTQSTTTGEWSITPRTSTLVITGTL